MLGFLRGGFIRGFSFLPVLHRLIFTLDLCIIYFHKYSYLFLVQTNNEMCVWIKHTLEAAWAWFFRAAPERSGRTALWMRQIILPVDPGGQAAGGWRQKYGKRRQQTSLQESGGPADNQNSGRGLFSLKGDMRKVPLSVWLLALVEMWR